MRDNQLRTHPAGGGYSTQHGDYTHKQVGNLRILGEGEESDDVAVGGEDVLQLAGVHTLLRRRTAFPRIGPEQHRIAHDLRDLAKAGTGGKRGVHKRTGCFQIRRCKGQATKPT